MRGTGGTLIVVMTEPWLWAILTSTLREEYGGWPECNLCFSFCMT